MFHFCKFDCHCICVGYLRLPRESVCREERKSYRIKSWGTLTFRYLVRAERTIKRKKNCQRGKEERYITLVKRRVAQEWGGVNHLWHATERKVKGINCIWRLWRLWYGGIKSGLSKNIKKWIWSYKREQRNNR